MTPADKRGKKAEEYTMNKGEGGFGVGVGSETLVIINQVHHRRMRGACVTADKRVSRRLLTGGDAYTRSIEADTSWAPVVPADCWIQTPGLVVIHNDENTGRIKNKVGTIEIGLLIDPTPDPPGGRDMHSPQKQEPIVIPLNIIYPGEPYSIQPLVPLSSLLLKSSEGVVKYSVFVFPS